MDFGLVTQTADLNDTEKLITFTMSANGKIATTHYAFKDDDFISRESVISILEPCLSTLLNICFKD